jgi:type IV secretion system protein VirB8
MLNKKNSPKIDQAVAQGVNFEVTIADHARRSEKRAWIVAFCSVGVSLMLGAGYLVMLPLKEKEPYIVLADAYSGTSQLSRLTDDVINRQITSSEAVNRSNVAHFIIARESYDLALTNMRDWPTVLTMAAPQVATPYMALHSSQNPERPYNLYGRTKAVRVKILSIVLVGGANGTTPKGATVRFQRTVYDKSSGATVPLDSKIATMEFVYKPNLRMDDQNRVENPLGFQVTSYRVDNDYGSAPPVEVPTNAPAQPAAQAPAAAAPAAPGVDPSDMPAAIPLAPEAGPAGAAPQQAVGIPPSPLPAENGAPMAPAGAAPQTVPSNAAPAARATPQSAANGGRR